MPGGVCREIGAAARAEIERRWPALNVDEISSASKNYQLRREHKAETPVSLQATMDNLAAMASGLRVRLLTLSEEANDHLWNDYKATGQTELFESIPAGLWRLQHAAMRAHNAEVGGDGRKQVGARHLLVSALAWQLQKAGLELNARPTGDLCRVVEVILHDLGEHPSDVRKLVGNALTQMNGNDHPAEP
jgi:hypothetical protein